MEKFEALAAVIAAHPDRCVVGRTRLQKTIRLLQRVGLETDYKYSVHFYGPYSEAVQSDIGLLEVIGLVDERSEISAEGTPYYVFEANDGVDPELVSDYKDQIEVISNTDAVVLELAATYDTFREQGASHDEALQRLRRMKADKCSGQNEHAALDLLGKLELPSA